MYTQLTDWGDNATTNYRSLVSSGFYAILALFTKIVFFKCNKSKIYKIYVLYFFQKCINKLIV